jgi:hypothetical protein
MLKVARPFYWHIGERSGGTLRGATAFVLQFDRGFVGITADHVIDEYLKTRDAMENQKLVCQLSNARIFPEDRIIDRNPYLDIATFEVDEDAIEQSGTVCVDCRKHWPPPDIVKNDYIVLAGFPDSERCKLAVGHYEMRAWGANAVADDVTDKDILTIYDPDTALTANVPKPPLGFNMSGCSGGPAFLVKTVNGLVRWFPVGLIYKGADGKAQGEFASFDRIHIRRLSFLQPDGTIGGHETGWLPNH